jgi:hypothetical protein
MTALDELAQWEATGLAVLESITYDAEGRPLTTTPTIEATATQVIGESSAVFTTSNKKLSFHYADGWVTRPIASLGATIANKASALDNTLVSEFAPGEVQILVLAETIFNLTPAIDLGLPDGASAMTFLQASMRASASFFTFDEPEETTINDYVAASVIGRGELHDGYGLIFEIDAHVRGVMQVLTAPGELDDWIPVAEDIARTLTYTG